LSGTLDWLSTKGKSKGFFSEGCCHKEDIADILGVSSGQLPIRYLGLPLTRVYPKPRHFAPLIDKVRSRMEGWQLSSLSFAGRVELVKCALHNVVPSVLSYHVF